MLSGTSQASHSLEGTNSVKKQTEIDKKMIHTKYLLSSHPQPALYDPHKDTFMCCLKNETPLAAEASGLINFPTPNSAQIKALGKATNPVQQMIPSAGLPQSFWPLPVCWDAGDPPFSLLQHRRVLVTPPVFLGAQGSSHSQHCTFLKEQKAAEGQGCERDKNVGILMRDLMDESMGRWSRKHS